MEITRRQLLASAASVAGAVAVGQSVVSPTALAGPLPQSNGHGQKRGRHRRHGIAFPTVRFPADTFATSPDGPGVLDVKALFGAVGDGVTDDTDAIIAAYDAVQSAIRDGAEWNRFQKVIYFPSGTYRVSQTLIYSFPFFPQRPNSVQEGLSNLRFRGESRDTVTIKLDDNCPGFEAGNSTPVLSFAKGGTNNTVATNLVEDLTIDVGSGNPGAVGLLFAGANNAAVRNVKVMSSDPAGAGAVGISLPVQATQMLAQNIEVIGFESGLTADAWSVTHVTVDGAEFRDQTRSAVAVSRSLMTLNDVEAVNAPTAIEVIHPDGQVAVLDSELCTNAAGGTAIDVAAGMVFARNVEVSGYSVSVVVEGDVKVTGNIDEYVSMDPVTALPVAVPASLDLPNVRAPHISWPNVSDWVSVNSFGATGDSVTDDTAAIQAAFNSGASVIYFRPGRYLVSETISVPSTVERINFMFSRMFVDDALKMPTGTPHDQIRSLMRIDGSAADPVLVIEDLVNGSRGLFRLFEHASTRTTIFSDIHAQRGAMYWNSADGGTVHFENVSARTGGVPGSDLGPVAFYFEGDQQVWARHINPEHAEIGVVNAGATVRIQGLKWEAPPSSTVISTTGSGSTEWIGGTVLFGPWGNIPEDAPIVSCEDSSVSATFATAGRVRSATNWPRWWTTYASEMQGADAGTVTLDDLPLKGDPADEDKQRFVPLYVGGP